MTKLLDNIEARCTNKRIPPKFPMMDVTSDVREFDYQTGYEYRLSVEMGCYITAKDSTELVYKQESVRRMIAKEVYGDVLQDFDEMCLALYERGMLDSDLMEMISRMTRKMTGLK